MMPPWNERPVEVANLLNPAFIGVLLRKAVEGYAAKSEGGMPIELLFLVLPISLHPATSSRLPRSPAATPLHVWLQREENRDVLLTFGDRAAAVVPFVREAILFTCERGVLAIDNNGRLHPGSANLRGITAYQSKGHEVRDAIRHSEHVGRWFALAGTTATIFTLLGVRP